MLKTTEIIVCGAAGRMGASVIRQIMLQSDLCLVAAIEISGSPKIGLDAGLIAGAGETGVRISSDLKEALRPNRIVISFANPEASLSHAVMAMQGKCPIVIGTTSFSVAQTRQLRRISSRIPVVLASNMSTGVNVLWKLAEEAARILGDYDVEIIEAHHNSKKDAPSGTAISAAQLIAKARGVTGKAFCYGRLGKNAVRKSGEIGLHAVRAGDIVGEHTVVFAGAGERVELTHRAHNRDNFATGSLRAARFVWKAKPGLYSMRQVLGIA